MYLFLQFEFYTIGLCFNSDLIISNMPHYKLKN